MEAKEVGGFSDADLIELMDKYRPEKQQPGDITLSWACKVWEVGRDSALATLKQMEEDGVVECVEGVLLTEGGAPGRVWRPT